MASILGIFSADVDPLTGNFTVKINTGVVSAMVRNGVGDYSLTTKSMSENDVVVMLSTRGDPNILGGVVASYEHITFTHKKIYTWGGAPLDRGFAVLFVSRF